MKLCYLVFATFFVLSFSDGARILSEAEIRDNVYSSYEKNLEKLKKYKLEYLVKDLDQIYEYEYNFVNAFWNYFRDKQNLLDRLEHSLVVVVECLDNELNETINYYEDLLVKLSKIMEESPKSPTCYEEMVMFFSDIKHHMRKELKNKDIHESIKIPLAQRREDGLQLFLETTFKLPDKLKKEFELFLEEYISDMVSFTKDKVKKKDIRSQSKEYMDFLFTKIDDLLQFHQEDGHFGMLNEIGVLAVIKRFEGFLNVCNSIRKELYIEADKVQRNIFEKIIVMERMASATFYIIDDKNNKELVDCEDHIPYFSSKPWEYVIKDEGDSHFFAGTDQNGRNYKRELIFLDDNFKNTMVREKIEYEDEVFDRTYFVEYTETYMQNIPKF